MFVQTKNLLFGAIFLTGGLSTSATGMKAFSLLLGSTGTSITISSSASLWIKKNTTILS